MEIDPQIQIYQIIAFTYLLDVKKDWFETTDFGWEIVKSFTFKSCMLWTALFALSGVNCFDLLSFLCASSLFNLSSCS